MGLIWEIIVREYICIYFQITYICFKSFFVTTLSLYFLFHFDFLYIMV